MCPKCIHIYSYKREAGYLTDTGDLSQRWNRKKFEDIGFEDVGLEDWMESAISQGMLAAMKSWTKQGVDCPQSLQNEPRSFCTPK